jgi:hypothetical protein
VRNGRGSCTRKGGRWRITLTPVGTDPVLAQGAAAPEAGSATATPDNAVLLTIFLRHDQPRPLGELNAQLAKQGFYKAFPPPGMRL